MFPLPYYAHDAGRIINNATTAVEVRDSEDTLKDTISLNLPTLTGKLNGVGESVVVFPEGLKSAGSVYDEISGKTAIKRFGIVDLGTLTWVAQTLTNNELAFKASVPSGMTTDLSKAVLMLCSQYQTYYVSLQSWDDKGDKSVWKRSAQIVVHDSAHTTAPTEQDNWLSGVFLIYELAEPETYILDNPIPDRFLAYAGGTIAQVPENTSTPTTAPMVMVNRYPVDFHGTMESLAAAITSMGLGTMAYANGKFTFTPNAE